VRIDGLEDDLQALADALKEQLVDIRGDVDANTLAIDGLLVDLGITSAKAMANMMAIENLEDDVDDLEDRATQHEDDIADLQSQIDALDSRVSTLEDGSGGPPPSDFLQFSGVRTDLPLAEANGWDICYDNPFGISDSNIVGNILGNCDKANIMLACRLTGADTLTVAAHAPRDDVFFETGTGNTVHNANGVDWYFSNNYSMGFSHEGDGVQRESCDTADGAFPEERVCYHTRIGGARGWRCGTNKSLSFNNSWERVVLQAD
jgi:hypothetical protein